ncbi:hypothetical protein BGW80DRAFT_766212 [Lactifluus volemus]|jgi:hypothetical protein|nr:hypothetical protein BGW80DRAFT_766212 [Lactifluus volemus]
MRPLVQIHHLARVTRCARYINPTFTSTRRFASAHSTPPQTKNSGVAGHSAESYSKEVDSTPPADSSTYQVDESSDTVQRPHKPPSGKYSQAGVVSEAYRTMDKQEPYSPPLEGEADKKLRYGGKRSWASEKGEETSRAREGPEGLSAGGRKPGKGE